MYEARQNKEKVSRRIDSNGRSRMTMNNIILPIQRLNTLNNQKNFDLNIPLEGFKKTGNIIQRQRLKKKLYENYIILYRGISWAYTNVF